MSVSVNRAEELRETHLFLNSMIKEEVCDCEVRGGGSSEWIRSWERVEKEGLEGRREECGDERC